MSTCVGVVRIDQPEYPRESPFHPAEAYPEYPFAGCLASLRNEVYAGVRRLFATLGLDADHFGSPDWNPLRRLIQPGMRVVIKPNFVIHRNRAGKDLFAVITHASVLRAVADYCWIALKGEGTLTFADGPQYDCDAEELMRVTGLDQVIEFYDRKSALACSYVDLRDYWSKGKHFDSMRRPLPGDPRGSVEVDLGGRSALEAKSGEQLYGAVYHREETIRKHSGGHHLYQISRTILEADVFISVPKLKVHKKVGVTLNAKGLVGIITNKNCLVHYTLQSPSRGGDQYPDGLFTPVEQRLIWMERWMYDHLLAARSRPLEYLHRSIYWVHNHSTKLLGLKVAEYKRGLDAGNWHGNDSAWRMTVDLVRILHFTDHQGRLQNHPQRRMFTVIDGIVGGEKNGPLTPDPKPVGVLLGGEHLIATDLVACRLMGFAPLKLKLYQALLDQRQFDLGLRGLDDIEVLSPEPSWRGCLTAPRDRFLDFRPHPGWTGVIEIDPQNQATPYYDN